MSLNPTVCMCTKINQTLLAVHNLHISGVTLLQEHTDITTNRALWFSRYVREDETQGKLQHTLVLFIMLSGGASHRPIGAMATPELM